jgi:hypothetical protein
VALEVVSALSARHYDAEISTRHFSSDGRLLVLTKWGGIDLDRPERILAVDSVRVLDRSHPEKDALRAVRALPSAHGSVTLTVQPLDSASGSEPFQRTLVPRRDGPLDFLGSGGLGVLLVLMGGMGLLALGARAEGAGPRRFVLLCLAGSLPLLVDVPSEWNSVSQPLVGLFLGGNSFLDRSGLVPVLLLLWPLVFGWALLSLLYVVPTDEPELRERFPMPEPPASLLWGARIGLVLAVGLLGLVLWGPDGRLWQGVQAVGWLVETGVILAATLYAFSWVAQTTRRVRGLVRLRRAQVHEAGDLGRRAQLALAGVDVGVKAFLGFLAIGFVIIATSVTLDLLWPGANGPAMKAAVVSVLNPLFAGVLIVAVGAPFLGTGLAVLRGGMWDVDLVAYRTALYSLFGVVFFLVWVGVDQAVEALVPGGLVGAGPVLAAVTVAGLQGPLARLVRRRINPGADDFEDVVERAAHRLGTLAPGASSCEVLAETLAEELGCPSVSVLKRDGERWLHVGGTADPASTLRLTSTLGPVLAEAAQVVVRTDAADLLAIRLGGPDGAVGAVLLTARDGRPYTADQRRMLSVMLAPTASLLRA